MQIRYSFEGHCNCPVDNLPDTYKITLYSQKVIAVEDIIKATVSLEPLKMFQEEYTQRLHRLLNCKVQTVGIHSGVTTKVVL